MSNEIVTYKSGEAQLDYCVKVASMFMKSGKFSSKDYNVETLAMLVMYAQGLGISPAQALINGFDIIQGKIQMKPALMSSMIRRAGHSIQVLKWEADECVIKGTRKDTGDSLTISFTMEDARRAGWADKAVYKQNPKNMLYSRAMGNLGRMLFGDIIGNPYAEDEIFEQEKQQPKFMTKPENTMETLEVSATTVQEVPKIEQKPRTIDDLYAACMEAGAIVDMVTLTDYVYSLRDKRNAKGDKTVDAAYIIGAAFLPDQMARFVKALDQYQNDLLTGENLAIPQV